MSAAAGIVAVQELSLTGEWVVSCRSAKILTPCGQNNNAASRW